jgi:ElaB/YqjD/DUF883 family membrane-anchored ribosome-binding protein
MFHRSGYARALSTEIGDIDQRLRALERRLEAIGGRSAASATQAVDHVGETIASALSGVAERLRGRADSVRDEVAKISGDAAKLGNQALRRLVDEVEHRPLITLAVAVGVGILVGLASHQAGRSNRSPGRRRH